ncbi:hypothetical protein AYI69_g5247 [Smittium culicis]|uniref:Uncharacterized protein n=1 Tax=Smittium culicis TaxID=133412 RepID=A0A1R1Y7J3_9FUNG|nr:hypothetical protein AYI69_g5247 [Smittium culicis]
MALLIDAPYKENTFKPAPQNSCQNHLPNNIKIFKLKKQLSNIQKSQEKLDKSLPTRLEYQKRSSIDEAARFDSNSLNYDKYKPLQKGKRIFSLNKRAWKSESGFIGTGKSTDKSCVRLADAHKSSNFLQVPRKLFYSESNSADMSTPSSNSITRSKPRSVISEIFKLSPSLLKRNSNSSKSILSDSIIIMNKYSSSSNLVRTFRKSVDSSIGSSELSLCTNEEADSKSIKSQFSNLRGKIGNLIASKSSPRKFLSTSNLSDFYYSASIKDMSYEPLFNGPAISSDCWSSEESFTTDYYRSSNSINQLKERPTIKELMQRDLPELPEPPSFFSKDRMYSDNTKTGVGKAPTADLNTHNLSEFSIRADSSSSIRSFRVKSESMISSVFKNINKKKDQVVAKSKSSTKDIVKSFKSKFT